MASILEVLNYPDARLRKVAAPVEHFNTDIEQLVSNMFVTMYDQKGIGLAATQVNVHLRILVLDVSESRDEPFCFINPVIQEKQGEKPFDEGCLSLPGESAIIKRPDIIRVSAFDQTGKEFEKECDGVMSVCLQHEMDHLEGKLFIDYLSPLKRSRFEKRLAQRSKAKHH